MDGLGGGGGIDFDIDGLFGAPDGKGGASEGRPGGIDLPLFAFERVLTKLYEPSSMCSALEESSSEMGGGLTLGVTCGGVDGRVSPAAIMAGAGGAEGRDPPIGRGGAFRVASENTECIPVSSADSSMEDESSSSGTSVVFFTRSGDPTFASGICALGRLWGGAGIPRGVAAPRAGLDDEGGGSLGPEPIARGTVDFGVDVGAEGNTPWTACEVGGGSGV